MKHQHAQAGMPDKGTGGNHDMTMAMGDNAHKGHHMAMNHAGHHAGMIADFRKRFYVVVFMTVPILLLSPMVEHWLGVGLVFRESNFVLLVLSSFVFVYGGWPFLTGSLSELRSRNPGMMTLVAMAIIVAYTYSAVNALTGGEKDFFWELDTLILIMLLGHWVEMRSVTGASRELELLVKLMPDTAHLLNKDTVTEVSSGKLRQDDLILVKPGERLPADGIITEGESYINESMLTGESVPVSKGVGQKVIAGSINGDGALRIRVVHGEKDVYLYSVIDLVRQAQQTRSNTQLLADKAAKWLTVTALVSGCLTLAVWLALGKDFSFAMERMVTVMVICCPHALGLAIPLVVARSTTLSARNGILIKDRTAFENARKITTVVFDKTGTLTKGTFEVTDVAAIDSRYSDLQILEIAAALESASEHPIAAGILAEAKRKQLTIPQVFSLQAIKGKGVEGTVNGTYAALLSPATIREMKLTPPDYFRFVEGQTTVYLLTGDRLAGLISLADVIRPESAGAVALLRDAGIKSLLLTGDNNTVAQSVALRLNMDGFYSEVLPHQKLDKIAELQSKNEFVAMTGDGVNDAPALAQADVGIAIGSGSDIASETAGVVLVNSNPGDVVKLVMLAKATYRKMIQNLIWATAYNVITLPLAAGVLYNFGIMVSPAAGAVLMTVSTVIVAINAGLLRLKPVN